MDSMLGRRVFEAVGKADQKATWTSWFDTGKAVTSMASMAPESVPEFVRILRDAKSVRECAGIMDAAKRDGDKIEVEEIPLRK